jgi:predicted O-methyltransferase YrrM
VVSDPRPPDPNPSRVAAWGRFRGPAARAAVMPIVRAYDSTLVRAYCVVRFRIIRGRFLEEIAQFLPREGNVLEIGCGFGLFGLYFARALPDLTLHGFDVDAGRIDLAESARRKLGLTNISFSVGDARTESLGTGLDAVYTLDIIHHLEPSDARDVLHRIYESLRPGGTLLVKDVDTRPRYKMAFTWLLDVLMTRGERPHYWSRADLTALLRDTGFDVVRYAMVDALPYPHELFLCMKPAA